MPRSLAMRLLLAAMGALYLTGALVCTVVLWVWPWSSQDFAQQSMASHFELIEDNLQFDAQGRLLALAPSHKLDTMYDALSKDVAYQVLDAQGQELFASPPGPALDALRTQPAPTRAAGDSPRRSTISASGIVMYLLERSMRTADGSRYAIRLVRSDRMESLLREYDSESFLTTLLVAIGLAQVVFVAVVICTVRRLVSPLRKASAIAASIGPRNLRARLQSEGLPSELQPLIAAFNHALERLEKGYSVQQDFLAAAAHELKTPLALFRAELEVGSENRQQLLKDVDLMARQVHQLLHLAEVSESRNYHFETQDIARVAFEVHDFMTRHARRHNVALDLRTPEMPVWLQLDRGAVFVLIRNLVENAIEHAHPASTVTVELTSTGLEVRNLGPSVTDEEKAQLYTRFWRGNSRMAAGTGGAGLGLSICREIALTHEWTLSLVDRPRWHGAVFAVEWKS